jgi:hypothetical protein
LADKKTEANKGKEFIEKGIKAMRFYRIGDLLKRTDKRSSGYLRSVAFNAYYLGSAASVLSYRQLLKHKDIHYKYEGSLQRWGNATGSYNVNLYSYRNQDKNSKHKRTYFAEYTINTRMESEYITITYFFGRKPKKKDLTTAYLINIVSSITEDKETKFSCRHCGKTIHWLDLKGDLEKKLNLWQDYNCGCKKEKA